MEYHESMQITKAFRFCPNAFRIDLYRGCSFGCKYCFANMECFNEQDNTNWREASIEKIKKRFYTALETDKESKDILIELLRHRVPLHCGGMSDPFQHREWKLGLTKEFIKISNQYEYPVTFSTKTAYLTESYLDILNPKYHAFQVSIMGWDDDYIRKWETNTDSAFHRVDFVRWLRSKGFWCSVRIQPIVDIDNVCKLLYNISGNCDYITVEHLRVIYDTKESIEAFWNLCDNKEDFELTPHHLQVKRDVKIKNIRRIKDIANSFNVKVGVGDNDLHYLSQSRNCCGIDLAGEAFSNYLKYNLTYLSTGKADFDNIWIPSCNPRKHINDKYAGSVIDCREYTNAYIKNHPDYIGIEYKEQIEKQLFGKHQKKLF